MSNLLSVRGYVQIPRFEDDPSLCPVGTINDYLNNVSFLPGLKNQTTKHLSVHIQLIAARLQYIIYYIL